VQKLLNARSATALLTAGLHLFGSLALTLAGIITVEWLGGR
jgi:hypothetical protein